MRRRSDRRGPCCLPDQERCFPLHVPGASTLPTRLKGAAFQPLIDKVGVRLAGWKGWHFTRAGRVVLARAILSAMVTYHLTAFKIPAGILRQINKLIRVFIWTRSCQPGQEPSSLPLVNWATVCRPRHLGGLGILDLVRFGRALRLRWPWLSWADRDRPWQGLPSPCGQEEMDLFRALTRILLGAGEKALFWHDAWLPDGSTLKLRWPGLFAITSRKNRTVQKELANRNWVRALLRIGTTQQLADFVSLWSAFRRYNFRTRKTPSLGHGCLRTPTPRPLHTVSNSMVPPHHSRRRRSRKRTRRHGANSSPGRSHTARSSRRTTWPSVGGLTTPSAASATYMGRRSSTYARIAASPPRFGVSYSLGAPRRSRRPHQPTTLMTIGTP